MLLNLISNAIKFTPNGGLIQIVGRKVDSPEHLSVKDEALELVMRQNPNKTFLEMQVIDNGIGVKTCDMPKLFQLFGFLDTTKQLNT